jgi:hypothetical protein
LPHDLAKTAVSRLPLCSCNWGNGNREAEALVVELRYFGGLECEEIAQFLGVSSKTVKRDWNKAAIIHRDFKSRNICSPCGTGHQGRGHGSGLGPPLVPG